MSALWSHCFTTLCVLGGLVALASGLWLPAAILLFGCFAHAWAVHADRTRHDRLA